MRKMGASGQRKSLFPERRKEEERNIKERVSRLRVVWERRKGEKVV